MRKFVLIPIVSLGKQPQGHVLEIYSEPKLWGHADFQALKCCGLTTAVYEVETVLQKLSNPKMSACHLYLGNYFLNLNGLKSLSLGLLLAGFMQKKSCHYHKIIVLGDLDRQQTHLPLISGTFFKTQLEAILALDKQSHQVPLVLPIDKLPYKPDYLRERLKTLNIELMPVGNLFEALTQLGIVV